MCYLKLSWLCGPGTIKLTSPSLEETPLVAGTRVTLLPRDAHILIFWFIISWDTNSFNKPVNLFYVLIHVCFRFLNSAFHCGRIRITSEPSILDIFKCIGSVAATQASVLHSPSASLRPQERTCVPEFSMSTFLTEAGGHSTCCCGLHVSTAIMPSGFHHVTHVSEFPSFSLLTYFYVFV